MVTTKQKTTKAKTPVKAKASRTVRRTPPSAVRPTTVDYYPNRMTVVISVLAAVILMLLALIVVTNQMS